MKMTKVLLMLAGTLLLSVMTVAPAGATFPGTNGKIAFSGDADGDAEIYVVPPGGGTPVQLTNNTLEDENPTFSADGKLIYWDQELATGKHVIMVMKVSGSGQKRLTPTKLDSWDPSPGPDGRVAFARTISGNSEIMLMNADGTGVVQLTNTGRFEDEPAFSPDGKTIAFVRSYHFFSAVFTMTAKGKAKTAITPSDADYYDPCFSPDGQRIAVDSDLTGLSDIYTMTKTGTDLVQVTATPDREILPKYSPDGTLVSYSSVGVSTEIMTQPLSGGGATAVTADGATDYNGGWQST